jgi:CheY-like chemotaxis protein
VAPPLNATTTASATEQALQPSERERSRPPGALDVVAKPFDPMNLASRPGQAAGTADPAA